MMTSLGWHAQKLPASLAVLALAAMYVIEVLAPFLLFCVGWPRAVAAGLVLLLQVGIQLGGNFGHFNVLSLVLCLPCFDLDSSLTRHESAATGSAAAGWALAALVLVGGAMHLQFNSWVGMGWLHWPTVARPLRRRWLAGLTGLYRALTPLRLVHAYGVFDPQSAPAVRRTPIIEGSRDGVTWRAYEYSYQTSAAHSPCPAVAPHHPRLDHAVFYESHGYDVCGCANLRGSLGGRNPYRVSHAALMDRLLQRILEGEPAVLSLFRADPFDGEAPPTLCRVSYHWFDPTTARERWATGRYWRAPRRMHTHMPPRRRDDGLWRRWLPPPELFHPDHRLWRARAAAAAAPRAAPLLDAGGGSLDSALLDVGAGPLRAGGPSHCAPAVVVSAAVLAEFWGSVLPAAAVAEPTAVAVLRAGLISRWDAAGGAGSGAARLWAMERVAGKLAARLFDALEPLFLSNPDQPPPPLAAVGSHFGLWLLCHAVILGGAAPAVLAALANPETALVFLPPEGFGDPGDARLNLLRLFWEPELRLHAKKLRLAAREAAARAALAGEAAGPRGYDKYKGDSAAAAIVPGPPSGFYIDPGSFFRVWIDQLTMIFIYEGPPDPART
jgi:hypothetical protein